MPGPIAPEAAEDSTDVARDRALEPGSAPASGFGLDLHQRCGIGMFPEPGTFPWPDIDPTSATMSDEKLSKRQQGRIDARREDRLAQWLEDVNGETASSAGRSVSVAGIVVSHLRGEIEVLTTGPDARSLRCFLRGTASSVVTGDRVLVDLEDEDRGVIVAALPRTSLLARHTARGLRPVCANLDLLLVTIAAEPAPHADLVDRYLLAAALDDLDVAVVVNKADTLDADRRTQLDAMLAPRRALGISVLEVSAHTGDGLEALRTHLAGRAAAFVGQSGVGKSSLINALVPDADALTGTLSSKRNRGRSRGRHTTSTTRLYLTGDAVIIDSPGIREFAPDVPDAAALLQGFPEIAHAAAHCRFSDCRHDVEPDCAVRAAMASGEIARSRFESLLTLRAALLPDDAG